MQDFKSIKRQTVLVIRINSNNNKWNLPFYFIIIFFFMDPIIVKDLICQN